VPTTHQQGQSGHPETTLNRCERQSRRVENMSNRTQTAGEKHCQGLELRREALTTDENREQRLRHAIFRIGFSPVKD
jgi:hypothetical protein